jgi:D-xylose transport system substrate-binding protein
MFTKRTMLSAGAFAAGVLMLVSACSNSSTTSSGTASPSSSATTSPAAQTSGVPDVSAAGFSSSFSSMTKLAPLVTAGKGKVGVLLPDTTSSARYVEFDAPLLTKAFTTAGLPASDLSVQNAHGDNATQVSQAQADITNGATVLVLDPLTSGVGAQIESYAKQHGATVIDYDRLTLGGSRAYYISFNNVRVGQLIGTGFASCATAWGVTKPEIIEMVGDPTDNNATLFAEGYNSVIAANPTWHVVAKPAGTWDPSTALSEFTQALTANKNANSAIIPNDENAAPIISYLQKHGVKAKTFPITGQDATSVGLQNILLGYQCGTVYKPIDIEAQAAAAVALYVRAGKTPPSDLVNGTTKDTQANQNVPSVLLTPEWVTTQNMESTVIKDGAVTAAQICTGTVQSACSADGIG